MTPILIAQPLNLKTMYVLGLLRYLRGRSELKEISSALHLVWTPNYIQRDYNATNELYRLGVDLNLVYFDVNL